MIRALQRGRPRRFFAEFTELRLERHPPADRRQWHHDLEHAPIATSASTRRQPSSVHAVYSEHPHARSTCTNTLTRTAGIGGASWCSLHRHPPIAVPPRGPSGPGDRRRLPTPLPSGLGGCTRNCGGRAWPSRTCAGLRRWSCSSSACRTWSAVGPAGEGRWRSSGWKVGRSRRAGCRRCPPGRRGSATFWTAASGRCWSGASGWSRSRRRLRRRRSWSAIRAAIPRSRPARCGCGTPG